MRLDKQITALQTQIKGLQTNKIVVTRNNSFNYTRPNMQNQELDNSSFNLKSQIDNAIDNKASTKKKYLGKANDFVIKKVKSLFGLDISNRKHILNDNDIRHMLKEHGDPQKEMMKGQIAITKDDIANIENIITNPDNIKKGTPNKLGETIRYIKKYSDNISYVVEVIPDNSNGLIIKTMWKKPSTLTNSITPSSTPKAKGSDAFSTSNDNNIPQTNKKVNLPTATTNSNMQNSEKNTFFREIKFYDNIKNKTDMLTDKQKVLEKAHNKLLKNGKMEELNWHTKKLIM